jgi:CheY-like chemotaxis protein
VESEPGAGSCFHFTLRAPVLATKPVADPLTATLLSETPTLIVDDNAASLRILSEIVQTLGVKPVTALDATQALLAMNAAALNHQPFKLVLLDCHMPGMDGFELAAEIKRTELLSGASLLMLTAANQRGDAALCRELGAAAHLTKPVADKPLLDAVRVALGGAVSARISARTVPRASTELQILLAEDNPVNQKVAVRLLEKRGYSVQVASTGREALDAVSQRPFDVILMDVQMPEMDGIEATMAIRAREQSTGGHIPVIALTAHAMSRDRDRCIAAGMDGYASKPIQIDELQREITRVTTGVNSEQLA